jgi:hypothetical protein
MDTKLSSIGYDFGSSKYTPNLGFSGFRTLISAKPTQRFFDARRLQIPTFDGRYFHQTQVTRHELAPLETFQVCVGEMRLDAFNGDHLRAFSFGGTLRASIDIDDLNCEFTSSAPVFKLQSDPGGISGVIADEILDLLAEKQTRLPRHEDELYERLGSVDPYQLFLTCLVSVQQRADSIPMSMRREGYHKLVAALKRAIQIVKDTDGWDGHAPNLDELLSKGGA